MNQDILTVKHLDIWISSAEGDRAMVRDVNLTVRSGRPLTLIGETGCGKTLVVLALLGLLPQEMSTRGQVIYRDRDILNLPGHKKNRLWGREIFLFPQEPVLALNPTMRASAQVKEIFRWIKGLSSRSSRRAAQGAFGSVGLAPDQDASRYPHQMSGGMRQRLVAAMALAEPACAVVADEPTKGLDEALRKVVVDQLKNLIGRGKSLITITHDIAVARALGGWLAVMYQGRIMEQGPCGQILEKARHPYTNALLAALPANGLRPIPFNLNGRQIDGGCVFSDRCSSAKETCFEQEPESLFLPDKGECRCFRCPG